MKIFKRLTALALTGNLITLAKVGTLEMAAVVLLNSGLLLYLEWHVGKRRKED